MISKDAVTAFINRPRRDLRHLKSLSRDDLLELVYHEAGGWMDFKSEPWKPQIVGFLIGIRYRYWLYVYDMGGGKTKLCLDLASHYKRIGEMSQGIVWVPRIVLAADWVVAAAQHSNLTVDICDMQSTAGKREVLLDSDADLVVIDYQNFDRVVSRKVGKEFKRDDNIIRAISRKYSFYAGDEFHRSGRANTDRSGIMRQLRKTAHNFYGFTGTAVDDDPEKLWAQFRLIDEGETLGETLGLFREAFAEKKINYFGGRDFKFQKDKIGMLHTMIQNSSIRYSEKDLELNLPPLIITDKYCALTDEQNEQIATVKRGLIVDGMRIPLSAALYRARQITAGYVDMGDPDNPEADRVGLVFAENPKLDLLQELIEQLTAKSKFLIFLVYRRSAEIVCKRLSELKIGHRLINGSVSTRQQLKNRQEFETDPKVRGLVLNDATGGEGLNLTIARYVFGFEIPSTPTAYKQIIKRAHRPGARGSVHFYNLIARRSADQRIMELLADGQAVADGIIDGKGVAHKLFYD